MLLVDQGILYLFPAGVNHLKPFKLGGSGSIVSLLGPDLLNFDFGGDYFCVFGVGFHSEPIGFVQFILYLLIYLCDGLV